ncbi:STAS domain-containing protein [Actinomadura kijaniata]|uniref:STAS domain-containing protein n=1 Tax=Actinomadura kijaniata TaxID=46161 RepID=UPI003F1B8459
MDELQLSHRHLPGGVTVVSVVGEVDLRTAGQLHAYLQQVRRTPAEHLVLDLTETPLLDSTGLQVLVNAHLYAAAHGATVRVAALAPMVQRVFTITQLGTHIGVHPTVEDALLAAMTGRRPGDGSDNGDGLGGSAAHGETA